MCIRDSIITYVDLLKDDSLDEATRREYVATLAKKSQRLKRLIEDLFEMSKAASGSVPLHKEKMCIRDSGGTMAGRNAAAGRRAGRRRALRQRRHGEDAARRF